MRATVWVGIALIVAGVFVYVRGGITRKEEVVDVGPLWPDPSTVLRLIDDEVELLRMGQGEFSP